MRVETIAEKLLFCTVRIATESANGTGSGTGFVFAYQTDAQLGTTEHYPFIVTNKHVVESAERISFWFTEKDEAGLPRFGQKQDIQINDFGNMWFGHPDPNIDIAIFALGPIVRHLESKGDLPFYVPVGKQYIPTAEQLEELDAIEDITFFGYPVGYFDDLNLLPIARRGTTATPPQMDYAGDPVFLIDASVFPGSSGSPVFVLNNGGYVRRGGFTVGSRVFFLGVVAAVLIWTQTGEVKSEPIPTMANQTVEIQQIVDLGVVYKASTVVEAIEAKLEAEGIAVRIGP